MTTATSDAAETAARPLEWYVLRGEHQSGPFEDAVLATAFAAGELLTSDYVWRDGFPEWVPAADVFGPRSVDGEIAGAYATAAEVAATTAEIGDLADMPAVTEASAPTLIEAPGETADTAETGVGASPALAADPPNDVAEPREAPVAGLREVIALPPDPEAQAAPPPPPLPAFVAAEDVPPPLPHLGPPFDEHEHEHEHERAELSVSPPAAEAGSAPRGGVASAVAGAATATASGRQRSTYPSDGAAPMWPMPIGPFLSGPYLQRADVVLTRKNRDIKSWLIRFATRGSFSHAAMVFLVPHQERGFNNSFVIESASDGVDLTNFRDLVDERRSVIGIKRMQTPWFTEEMQCAVRGRLLNSIKSSYNYATILRLARQFFADVAFGIKSRVYGPGKAIASAHARHIEPPSKFICSGLVQLGFVHTLLDMADQKRLPAEFLSDVVFRDDLAQFLPKDWSEFTAAEQHDIMWEFSTGFADLLEAVTPEDLAASPKLEWVYVIKRGLVYPVSSDAEVRELLTWKPKKRKG